MDAPEQKVRIRLYTQTVNPFAEKVARALHLKGLPYERVVSDDPADVKRWSPVTGALPVLEIEGDRIADSPIIVRELDARFPDPPLLDPDPVVAAQQESLAEWSDSSFSWHWNRWRAARYPRPGDELPCQDGLLGRLRDRFLGGRRAMLTRAQVRELEVMDDLARRLDDLVRFLGDRPYFHSDRPSLADLSVFGMLQVVRDGPMELGARIVAERPTLSDYLERMERVTRGPDGEAPPSYASLGQP
ncbi:MAG: glutathione S-transferase family protein [Proteobacteria bacterium]|nr:glutathione S-transferase family protein [Pseudomonadota bacterium]